MKKWIVHHLCAALLISVVALTVVFAEYHGVRPITGGSAEQLTTTLAHAGYNGPTDCSGVQCQQVDELTLCTPSGSPTLYIGNDSTVNASTGYPIEGGACQHYKSGSRWINTDRFWIYASSNSSIAITLR